MTLQFGRGKACPKLTSGEPGMGRLGTSGSCTETVRRARILRNEALARFHAKRRQDWLKKWVYRALLAAVIILNATAVAL